MANRQLSPVSYNRFDPQPLLSEGLLPVSRDLGADLDRKVASGMFELAGIVKQKTDEADQKAGAIDGAKAALDQRPEKLVKGGGYTTASPNGQAGHIAGASALAGSNGSVDVASTSVKPVKSGAKAGEAKAYLMQRHGLKDWQASALAGQFQWESGFDPTIVGDGGEARGIAQWHPDRYSQLIKFANANGGNPTSVQTQLDFAVHELQTSEKAAGDRFFGSGDVVSAVNALMGYERPKGWTPDNPAAGHGYNSRLALAKGLVDAAYQPLSADATGPVGVVQVQKPVTIEAGKPGGFRPMAGSGAYVDAYNAAGTRTYLQTLQMTMLDEQDQLAQQYKADPAGLERAMGDLLKAHLQDHVFPQVAGDYELAFRKNALAHVMQARDAQEKKVQEDYRAGLQSRIGSAEDQKARILAGTDFSAAASDRLGLLQRTVDDQYDAMVSQNLMTPAQAKTAKKASRDQLNVDFYLGQSRGMKPAEIATMRESMRQDFAAGKLPLSADAWEKIDVGLKAQQTARTTQNNALTHSLERRSKDMAERLAGGGVVTPDEIAKFQADAAAVENGKDIAKSALTRLQVAQALRQLPIGEAQAQIAKLLQDGTSEDIKFGQDAIRKQREALKNDPLGMAERFGVLRSSPPLPIDGDVNASTVAGAFGQRIADAEAAAKHFGVEPVYFKPGEADQIEAAVKDDPARGLQIAAGLVSAAGPNAQRVLRELGKDAPAVALAGGLVAAGGSAKAAADIIAGHGKTPDGKDYADMPVTKRMPLAQAQAGSALVFTPDQVTQTDAAAAAIARKRLYDAGIDPKHEEAKPVYERAYQEAAGAIFNGNVQFGGFADYKPSWNWKNRRVLVDNRIRADRLPDVIGALTDADIGTVKARNGKTWTAKDIQGAMPVAVKGGYAFALGDPATSPMFIADENGNPLVIDIAGMADKLKTRVPEAFR